MWLKRIHAWTGIWGAILFLLIGLSGFLLNHRSILKIDVGAPKEVATITVSVDPSIMTSPEALTIWVKDKFNITAKPSKPRKQPAKPALFADTKLTQPAKWSSRFIGPNATVEASYTVGANTVSVTKRENNLMKLLINLHKGSGLGVIWVLFFDTLAGALIFMSITGILLWSKLHGSRLMGAGLLFGGIAAAVAATLPSIL